MFPTFQHERGRISVNVSFSALQISQMLLFIGQADRRHRSSWSIPLSSKYGNLPFLNATPNKRLSCRLNGSKCWGNINKYWPTYQRKTIFKTSIIAVLIFTLVIFSCGTRLKDGKSATIVPRLSLDQICEETLAFQKRRTESVPSIWKIRSVTIESGGKQRQNWIDGIHRWICSIVWELPDRDCKWHLNRSRVWTSTQSPSGSLTF